MSFTNGGVMATPSALFSTGETRGLAAPGTQAAQRRARVELAVGYGLILATIWSARPLQAWLYAAALTWIVAVTWVSFDGWKVMGLRTGGMLRSLWVVGVALMVALVAVLVAARMGTLNSPHGAPLFVRSFWGYTIWAFMQQFLLQDFVLLRLLRSGSSKRAAVLVAAGLFGLAHLPSPILTTVTLVWGTAACCLFLQYRNIYVLGMAHAILGVCLATVVPGHVDHNMRVGLGYLRYHPRGRVQRGQRSPSVRYVPADVWALGDDPQRWT